MANKTLKWLAIWPNGYHTVATVCYMAFPVSLFQRDDCGYGFKRFLRDGHHTVREDHAKRFYDIAELTVSKDQHWYDWV